MNPLFMPHLLPASVNIPAESYSPVPRNFFNYPEDHHLHPPVIMLPVSYSPSTPHNHHVSKGGFPHPRPQGHHNVEYDYYDDYWKSAPAREMINRLLSSYRKCKSLEEEPTLPTKVSQHSPEFNHRVFTTNHTLKYSEEPFLPIKLPQHSPPTTHEQKKQKRSRWSEEEHRLFLKGLIAFGKGDWKSISTYYLPSRTHIQIASHAQKYFNRHTSGVAKKKIKSINDITC